MTSEQTVSEVHSHQGQLPLTAHSTAHQAGSSSNGASNESSNQSSNQSRSDGQDMPHGMGQSKSSRRRRRKRKGKGPDEGQESAGDASSSAEVASPSLANSANGFGQPGASPVQGFNGPAGPHQNGHPHQNGASAGGKRWKKKFRDRERQQRPAGENGGGQGHSMAASAATQPPGQQTFGGARPFRDSNSHQPGNGGSFKRKGGGGGKQQGRGPRSFVGPMDHSYRAVNGNFAETPPSTIEPHGNYGGGHVRRATYQSDSQPIDYSQGRPVPIAADAPTKIYFFIDDLFFIAKIGETARKLGVKVAFVKNDKESVAALTSHEEDDRPGLIVFDLNNANAKPMTLIPKLKAKLKKGTSIVGFLSHLQGDLKAKAVEAGCDTVMPRAAFSQNLPNLLRRYGIADEEEQNFNQ